MAEDVAEAITRVENVLRDLIEETLRQRHGDDWLAHLSVSEEELDSWRKKQQEDRKRRGSEIAEERLLYYADLHDLAPILKKNWQLFSLCLGDLKEIEVYLGKLEDLRPPQAHGRTLLPFEKNLVLGISGDIRQKVTVYRSKQSPESEFFARIESVKDSLGNVLAESDSKLGMVVAKEVLRVGDEVIFSCSGWDPNGRPLLWALSIIGTPPARTEQGWSTDDSLVWHVSETDIGESTQAQIFMRSQGPYHSQGNHDGLVIFMYTVLPAPRRSP
jgi:hypothetical protein